MKKKLHNAFDFLTTKRIIIIVIRFSTKSKNPSRTQIGKRKALSFIIEHVRRSERRERRAEGRKKKKGTGKKKLSHQHHSEQT